MPTPRIPPLRILLPICSAACFASARTVHVDSRSGSDSASGATAQEARKTLAGLRDVLFKPGDSLLFARGGAWERESLYVAGTGKVDSPIVVGAYGDVSLPRPHLSNTGMLVVLRSASHVVVQDLELSGARAGCLEMRDSSVSHATVRRIEAHDCGCGISLSGTDLLVEDNQVHDGHMVVNTKETMDDDYGATGIGFSRVDGCVVRGNRLWKLSAPSFDYGEDGGALEFWKTTRNCDIHGNFAHEVNGFAEFGGQKGDSVVGVAVHHNVALENGPLACFHFGDPSKLFGVDYDSVRFDNNLSVTRRGRPASHHLIADGAPPRRREGVKVRNNILVTDSSNYYNYQEGHSLDPSWIHEANLVWNPINDPFSSVGRVRGAGEVYANPRFREQGWNALPAIDTVLAHYGLRDDSPARATGLFLGYATDFFGKPAAPGGIVDMGPFAHGSFQGIRRLRGESRSLRALPGAILATSSWPVPVDLDVVVFDASGRSLAPIRRVRIDPGTSHRVPFDVPPRPAWVRARWTMEGGVIHTEVVRVPPVADRSR